MIKIDSVSKTIKKKEVLKDISFNLYPHQVTLIRGHRGSGKTMLLRLICGLIQPTKGEVLLADDYFFGTLIEQPAFFEEETAFYNLQYLAKMNNQIDDSIIEAYLKRFKLYQQRNDKVKTYSSDMKQRLALLQAFMEDPDVVLLDEPFKGIEEDNLEMIYN